jgi:multidrug efflux pump subunit AcrB
MIGLVLFIGLVAKNSILLVDLTNQMREKGAGWTTRCAPRARCGCVRCS